MQPHNLELNFYSLLWRPYLCTQKEYRYYVTPEKIYSFYFHNTSFHFDVLLSRYYIFKYFPSNVKTFKVIQIYDLYNI